jgi:hypothetical protein
MSGTQSSAGSRSESGTYEIRLAGHLDKRWAAWFDDLRITPQTDGTTVLLAHRVDQAALHGLLHKVRDLNLTLIAVVLVEPGPPRIAHPVAQPGPATHQPTPGSTS